jgi:predicted nucleic acid-binding protein
MATYYADSSVLVKRHVPELGTHWVQTLTDPAAGHLFITSRVSVVEGISALNRRQREGSLGPAEFLRMVTDFEGLCATTYQLMEVTPELMAQTRRLLEQHVLRAYDAVQLASALLTDRVLRANGEALLTLRAADERVLTVARVEGWTWITRTGIRR